MHASVCVCSKCQPFGRQVAAPHSHLINGAATQKGKENLVRGKRKRKRKREIFVVAHQRLNNFIGLFSVFISFNFIFLLYKKRAKNDRNTHTHT